MDDVQAGRGRDAAGGIGPVAIVGRLREGVTLAAAQAELSAIHRDVETGYAENFSRFVVHLTTIQGDNTHTVRATLMTVSGLVCGSVAAFVLANM